MPQIAENSFVKFGGPAIVNNSVPADVLVRTIAGLQQTILLIAAADEPTTTTVRRFRPSDRLKKECQLVIGNSRPSSWLSPLFLGENCNRPDLLKKLHAFLAALAVSDVAAMSRAIPDSFYRNRAIKEAINYLPGPGQRWHIDFSGDSGTPVHLDQNVKERIAETLAISLDDDVSEVIAELISIDFKRERVTALYEPTQKKIICQYPVDAEDVLYGSRRTKVKISGLFERDNDGHPIKCLRVDSIDPFDLSSYEISTTTRNGVTLILEPPLSFKPQQDEESLGSVLYVELPEINLHAFSRSRDGLITETENAIHFLWDAYAKCDQDLLEQNAIELSRKLNSIIREA